MRRDEFHPRPAAVEVRMHRNAVWPRTTPVLFDLIVLEDFVRLSAQYLLQAADDDADGPDTPDTQPALTTLGAWQAYAPHAATSDPRCACG